MDAVPQTQRRTDDASSQRGRRVRDFRRVYKACELCRRKKIRCVVDGPGKACLRCQRELTECVFSPERSHRRRSTAAQAVAASPQEVDQESISTTPSPLLSPQETRVPIQQRLPPPQNTDIANSLPRFNAQDSCAFPENGFGRPSSDHLPAPSGPASGVVGNGDLAGSVMRTLVSNGNDAMRLLFQAAAEHAPAEGETPSNAPSTSRTVASAVPVTTSPENIPTMESSGSIHFSPISYDVLKVWRAFRFTKMGWFTAEETVMYVDLFHKNLAPLSPVSKHFDMSHGSHFKLITQEPLLCSVILMISTRYHLLPGTGGVARSALLHHRLWEHCQHLVMRIMFGQEKRSKAKTRTRGFIEALLLMIEWHPRAIHFPPAADGWDSSLIITDSDPRDDQFGYQADAMEDSEARWLGDVVAPAKTSDRMSWMLLGCAQSLALELGLSDVANKGDQAAILNQPPGLQAPKSRLFVDRVLGRRLPNATDAGILRSSTTATDYAFIKEVIDGSCQTLESVNKLFEAGTLRYSPIRIFLRIITASIFLLKALSLGTRTADLEASLATMERSIEALRASSLDEMHLAARYGELLAMHLARFRHGMVPASIPRGIPAVDTTSRFKIAGEGQQLGEGEGDLSSLNTADDWLALPFDPSMAPFGFSGDVPELPELDDRSWDLLWSLPNV
ncbi:hypothetical protein AK830_g10868 [Neonectria ditissima]|uniref:Zn(2)-C6 fungal-type domain-containing protein n=1 Tax=Neonectria ditissima TaxID=78410 RepID=A0A0P7B2R3_9HYPO|nr:hypothetical protein AK830_g10868 [Neonectria ditissima]